MSRRRASRKGLLPSPAFVAPAITAGLLAFAAWSAVSQEATIEDRLRTDRIAALLAVVPDRLGPWITTEVPVPSEAVEILRPNAIFCRRFMRIGGDEDVTVILVHCADARDMAGHYPPICYRQIGWTLDLEGISRPRVESRSLGDPTMCVYRFRRTSATGDREEMTVLNGFLLPDGRTSPDVFETGPFGEAPTRASRGIAQLQLVFGSDLPDDAVIGVARDVLSELPREALRALIGTPFGETP